MSENWHTMGLLQVEFLFMALVICRSSVVLGQSSVAFQYSEDGSYLRMQTPNISDIQYGDIKKLGDFNVYPVPNHLQLSTAISVPTAHVSGACLYNEPIELTLRCACINRVNSFGTMFQFTIFNFATRRFFQNSSTQQNVTVNSPVLDNRLAFIITAMDNSTLNGDGDYLNWPDSETNRKASKGHYLAVELNFYDFSSLGVAVHKGYDSAGQGTIASKTESGWSNVNLTDVLYHISSSEATITVWVQYDGGTQNLEVFVSPPEVDKIGLGEIVKPTSAIISVNNNLFDIFSGVNSEAGLSGLYVGLSGSLTANHWNSSGFETTFQDIAYSIQQWTFNSDGLAPDVPRNSDGSPMNDRDLQKQGAEKRAEKFRRLVVTKVAITIPSFLVLFTLVYIIWLLYWRNARLTALTKIYNIDTSGLDRGGCNFKYKILSAATKGFSSSELLGSGGFGSVYKGRILLKGEGKPIEVAVKRISATSSQGAQEFLAEVKIIGQAQHRNLVRLLGWCHERGELLLVYDYMPNGSVDQHLFKNTDDGSGVAILTWSRRLKIVSGLAAALTYLHEEWEKLVIHRDVKCSNVMLDRDFNARLGDFGLARLYELDSAPASTAILAGTPGYMAPELFHTLKATEKTDVYSFGAVVLEMATGKKPILSVKDRLTTDHVLLVDWVWGLYENDAVLDAADSRLENAYDRGEMIMFVKIGLLCSHPDPTVRPSMREVVNIWKGLIPFPPLPISKPVPTYAVAMSAQAGLNSSFLDYSVLDSAYDTAITVPSLDDIDSTRTQKPEERSGDLKPSLRHRPRTPASLPF